MNHYNQLDQRREYVRNSNTHFHKFKGNGDLRDFLLDTGDKILVEASPYDTIWGIGMKEDNPDCLIPRNWKGENLLGFCLMEVRNYVRKV